MTANSMLANSMSTDSMSAVSQGERRRARQSLAESAHTAYRNMRLHIKEESGQKVAYNAAGERVGVVSPQTSATLTDGQTLTLRYALGRGGDLQAVVVGSESES